MTNQALLDEEGFTLVEIMIATFIFSLVMAALSVIYSTAYRQGTRMLHDMKLKGMAIVSLRSIESELQEATRLDAPAAGAAGNILEGFKNYGATHNPASPYQRLTDSEEVEWFHFCVSDVIDDKCAVDLQHEPKCLWMYTGVGTTINGGTAIDCGNDAGGIILSSRLEKETFGEDEYFSRKPAPAVDERNQVRVNWVYRIPALNIDSPMLSYKVDSTYNLGFSE
jgi:prepilin-type N-terminal cleavage/methylation domain-containing protein